MLFVPSLSYGGLFRLMFDNFCNFRFSSELECLSKILISLRECFWYIMILPHLVYSLSNSVHYFVLITHFLGGVVYMHVGPD